MCVQNCIKLSAAVHELSWSQRKKTPTKTTESVATARDSSNITSVEESVGYKASDQSVRRGLTSYGEQEEVAIFRQTVLFAKFPTEEIMGAQNFIFAPKFPQKWPNWGISDFNFCIFL